MMGDVSDEILRKHLETSSTQAMETPLWFQYILTVFQRIHEHSRRRNYFWGRLTAQIPPHLYVLISTSHPYMIIFRGPCQSLS